MAHRKMSLDEPMLPACVTAIFTHYVAAIKRTLLRYNFTGAAARAYLHINKFSPDKKNCVSGGGNKGVCAYSSILWQSGLKFSKRPLGEVVA